MKNIEYKAINVTLPNNVSTIDSSPIKLPDGKVIGIAAISTGNDTGEIINLSILDNGNEVLKPADIRFSQQQAGGGFLNSLRQVDFNGGLEYNIRLTALTASRTNPVIAQVLFAIVSKNSLENINCPK